MPDDDYQDDQAQSEVFDETHIDDEGDGDILLDEADQVIDVTQTHDDAEDFDEDDLDIDDQLALDGVELEAKDEDGATAFLHACAEGVRRVASPSEPFSHAFEAPAFGGVTNKRARRVLMSLIFMHIQVRLNGLMLKIADGRPFSRSLRTVRTWGRRSATSPRRRLSELLQATGTFIGCRAAVV